MEKTSSLSVIMPAFNEEKTLEASVNTALEAIRDNFSEYEIIIFNDGSTDKTGSIADRLAKENKNISVVHHAKPISTGGIFKEGRKIATKEYLTVVYSKNETSADTLKRIFALRRKHEVIIPYFVNSRDRNFSRRVISGLFVGLLNAIFGLKIKYYNHSTLYRRAMVNSIGIWTNSYAYQAEILIKLIKSGYEYVEVGVVGIFKKRAKTKAFRLKNVLEVSLFFMRLIYEVYISGLFTLSQRQRGLVRRPRMLRQNPNQGIKNIY